MIRRFLYALMLFGLLASISSAQRAVPNDARITLERTLCYGTCDWYKLSISADGEVVLEPKSIFVGNQPFSAAAASGKISVDDVKRLILAFESVNYFTLRSRYDDRSGRHCRVYFTDMPVAITSITIRRRSKEIYHYHGCTGSNVLEKLRALEDKIDEIAGTGRWLKELRTQLRQTVSN